ncbi:MAG: MlaD family protein [Chitinispirillaceae bacterium]
MEQKKRTAVSSEPLIRRHRNFFVGAFILIPLLAIPVLLVYTILKNDGLQKWCTLHVIYENSLGLKNGNQVTISGTAIGHVRKVELIREREVCVHFRIRGRYNHLVRKDTRAQLKQKGFVGDWEIELTGGSELSSMAKEGDTLVGEDPVRLDKTIESAAGMIGEISQLVKTVRNGEGTVGKLLTEDSLYHYAKEIGENTVGISRNTKGMTNDMRGTLRRTDSLILALRDMSVEGKTFVDTLFTVIATLKSSLEETKSIVANIRTVSDDAPGMVDRLQENIAEAEIMMRALQKNWLLRKTLGEQPDPLLKDLP